MQWDQEPAELGTAPGTRTCSEMETVPLTTITIIYSQCLRAWYQEPLRFPGFERINTDMDRAGIFRNKAMIKERKGS